MPGSHGAGHPDRPRRAVPDTGGTNGARHERHLAARPAQRGYDGEVPRYDPATALIVVDVQNDFADPAGGLAVPDGDRVVPVVNRAIAAARAAGATVVYTQDWHPAVTPHFAKDGGIWPVHCVAGHVGRRASTPTLVVDGRVVRKGSERRGWLQRLHDARPQTGLDVPTELDGLLRAAGVTPLVVCGLATDHCVEATALDGRRLGYPRPCCADAIAAVELAPGDGEAALRSWQAAGVDVDRRIAPSPTRGRSSASGGAIRRRESARQRASPTSSAAPTPPTD